MDNLEKLDGAVGNLLDRNKLDRYRSAVSCALGVETVLHTFV